MSIKVGIDLGTTNSAIAYIDEFDKATVIPNSEGKHITPSVICYEDEKIVVGEEAKELQKLGLYDSAAFFKREMGDESFFLYLGNKEYSATELSSFILKKLKNDAEEFLGKKITDAVITVPAYFKEKERQATIEAGRLAGLNVLQIVNEPTAAAIAFGLKNIDKNQKILVYDLGGGTFDVTLMNIHNNTISIINSNGDHHLGGKDWDDRIISYIQSKFEDEFGIDPLEDSESVADLLVRAEEAKKKLSSLSKTSISISYNGDKGKFELSREVFEDITADLMERTISLTNQVLEEVSLEAKDVDGILLVGGSTRMPMVHKFIKERFQQEPLKGVNVDEAVALGAALLANKEKQNDKSSKFFIGGRIKVEDVTNHSLGTIVVNKDYTKYVNSILLRKNTPIPAKNTKEFLHSGRLLEIYLTQGESREPVDIDYLGKYIVKDIPFNGDKIKISITYEYDINGVVKVFAKAKDKELPIIKEEVTDDIRERFSEDPKKSMISQKVVYIMIDVSWSMSGKPLIKAKEAAIKFVNGVNLDYTKIGIIIFSDRDKVILTLSNNKKKIINAINSIKCGDTGCCNDSIPFNLSLSLLNSKIDAKRIVIVLTDGEWYNKNEAINSAKRHHSKGIEVIAIGFGDADESFLKQVASSSERGIFTNLDNLEDTFSTIAQEIGGNMGGLSYE